MSDLFIVFLVDSKRRYTWIDIVYFFFWYKRGSEAQQKIKQLIEHV